MKRKVVEHKKCIDCGVKIHRTSTRCMSCSTKNKHKEGKFGEFLSIEHREKIGDSRRGLIERSKDAGMRGIYKGKPFRYAIKLAQGMERHHIKYIDTDPNIGVVFLTPTQHARIHNYERLFLTKEVRRV